jgi:hypothetical protein
MVWFLCLTRLLLVIISDCFTLYTQFEVLTSPSGAGGVQAVLVLRARRNFQKSHLYVFPLFSQFWVFVALPLGHAANYG